MATGTNDPTYVKSKVDANPAWALAWRLSEFHNESAPIGWGRYVPLADLLIACGAKQDVEFSADIDRALSALVSR